MVSARGGCLPCGHASSRYHIDRRLPDNASFRAADERHQHLYILIQLAVERDPLERLADIQAAAQSVGPDPECTIFDKFVIHIVYKCGILWNG